MCSPFPVADRISDEEFTRASKILKQYSHKWRTIGEGLGFKAIELDNIMSRPLLLSGAPISYLSTILSEWHLWAPGDHRGSNTYATLHSLRMALDKAGLGRTAQELQSGILWYYSSTRHCQTRTLWAFNRIVLFCHSTCRVWRCYHSIHLLTHWTC